MSSGEIDLHVKVLAGNAENLNNLPCNQEHFEVLRKYGVEVIDGSHLPRGLGAALNYLVSLDEQLSGEFTVICDVDVAMVKKNWDKDTVELLQKYDLIGIPYQEPLRIFDGPKAPSNPHFYHKIPAITWMAFRNNPVWKKLDFRTDRKDYKISAEESKLLNLPEGSFLSRDVGWRIPYFLKEHSLTYFSFENVGNEKPGTPVILKGIPNDVPWPEPGKSGFPCDEGLLNGIPFVMHQRLAQRWRFRQSKVSEIFYDLVDQYIEKTFKQ